MDCEVGYEDPGSGECEECQRGYYKDVTGPTTCKRCEDGSITSGTGATSEDDCNIGQCYVKLKLSMSCTFVKFVTVHVVATLYISMFKTNSFV